MDNSVAPGLHISACPSLSLFVLKSLTLTRLILKKRTPGLCSNTWGGFHLSHFHPPLFIGSWLEILLSVALCSLSSVQTFNKTPVLVFWVAGRRRRVEGRGGWDEGERETGESYILMCLKKMEEEEGWEEEERETDESHILMSLKKMEEVKGWEEEE